MKKRIFSLFLVICMIASLITGLTLTVTAESSGTCGANLTWTLDDKGVLTISGSGKMSNWSIYSNAPWYSEGFNIKTVTIESGVTSIGDYAFYFCRNLTSAEIPDSVASIGRSVFSGCSNLTSVIVDSDNENYSSLDGNLFDKSQTILLMYAMGKKDAEYTIPDSVTSIGSSAFYRCSNLTNITIPNSVTSIGSSAFSECGLTSAEIPDSVKSIEDNTFYRCNKLADVIIGNGVTSIGYRAFAESDNLTSVKIGNSVTSIGYMAFYKCSGLTSITIPNSVTSIGRSAFWECISLTSATIGNSASIGETAFNRCSNLTNVTIESGVKSIGVGAFAGCSSLTNITIPNSVTSIGTNAFVDCSSLANITVDSNNENFSSLDGNLFDKTQTKLIKYATGKQDTQYIIPDSVTSIDSSAFSGCSLICIIMPNSVESIGSGAFSSCFNINDVYYKGSEEQWGKIRIDYDNNYMTGATIHYNYIPEADSNTISFDKENNSITIESTGAISQAEFIVVLYKDGRLLKIQRKPMSIIKGTNTLKSPISYYGNSDTAKIMIWDDIMGMKSLFNYCPVNL